ncbi:hypothetical protein ABW17_11925 [Mycobacterium nebraskense]|uniref:hypothetical protein n=1 Tax=Mycobacterium nebraskense TaxID=244292 RepID=UPI00064282EF|nr:hypothetical protein [Mycobacterium nebraskense]KLO42355.1 hypothetical protein ABW17_11925 [Mycobacterium nebraskense]
MNGGVGGAVPPEDTLGDQQVMAEASRSQRLFDLLAENARENVARYRIHEPSVFTGDITIFSATRDEDDRTAFLVQSWRPHVSGEILTYSVDRAHNDTLTNESVGLYGQRLTHLLVLAERRLELAHGAATRDDKLPGERAG